MSQPDPAHIAAPTKRCTQCGIDVTRRRRIKDRQGRYMCGHCHELFFGDPNHPSGDAFAGGLDDTRIDEDGMPAMNNDSSTGTFPSRTADRNDRHRSEPGLNDRRSSGTDERGGTGFGTAAGTHPGVFTHRGTSADQLHDAPDELRDHLLHDDPDDSSIVDPDESADALPLIGTVTTRSARPAAGAADTQADASRQNLPRGQRIPLMEASYRHFALMVGVQVMMHLALIGAAFAGRGWVPIAVLALVLATTAAACAAFSRVARRVDWEGSHRVLLPIVFFVPVFGAIAIVLTERRVRRRVIVRGGNPSIVAMFGEADPDEASA